MRKLTKQGNQWIVTLEVVSDLKPTELAIMVNMFPGVVDAFIARSRKVNQPEASGKDGGK